MPHFVENLRMYKFDYPGNEVWLTSYKKYTDKMTDPRNIEFMYELA